MLDNVHMKNTIKLAGVDRNLLKEFRINDSYILGVYQGSISVYDMLIKYKQKINGRWSYMRTPKHIHWTVDILIKMYNDRDSLASFISFLEGIWNNVTPHTSFEDRQEFLDRNLPNENIEFLEEYDRFNANGEYSIKFLLVLAKLLMQQEKNNREDAYMFKRLLEKIRGGEDLFRIMSIATHR